MDSCDGRGPTRRIRVLHVTPYFAPAFTYGGPPRSVFGLCRSLVRAGIGVEVLTTTANGRRELAASPREGAQWDGVRVHYLPRAFPRRMFRSPGFRSRLRALLHGVDLLHIHTLWNITIWIAAQEAGRARIPYVISPRGMLNGAGLRHHAWRKQLAYALVERRNIAGAALLHATSPSEHDALLAFGVPVVMIPNGIDVVEGGAGRRDDFRLDHGIPTGAPLVVFLGRIHPMKRVDLLLEAFGLVHRRFPQAHLVIAGPDEADQAAALQSLWAHLGGAIHWTGELGDEAKARLLTDANVLVMCSDSESFGLSVAEALAAGVPAVVTQTCPWPSLEEAHCGFWVPQTPSAIAEAVGWLLAHPEEARAMGRRGQALVRRQFNWSKTAQAMARHYRNILAAKSASSTTE